VIDPREFGDPTEALRAMMKEARDAGTDLVEAAALATASPDGSPSVRMVLVKEIDADGVVFYTNLESPKAKDLAGNPRGALLFWWPRIDRQVRLEGPVEPVSMEEADRYFASRPRGHQLAAWASRQSDRLSDPADLEKAFREAEMRFAGRPVPRPPFWGGFRLRPETVEFWKEEPNRLHERIRFRRAGERWVAERLWP
jgi:pyridoxamine 5'-phosphate oxidase